MYFYFGFVIKTFQSIIIFENLEKKKIAGRAVMRILVVCIEIASLKSICLSVFLSNV